MDFLTQYENNKVKKSLFSEYEKIMEKHVETYQKVFPNTSDDKIEPTLKNIEKVVEHLKKKILDEDIAIDPFFDEELLKHLDNLHNFISSYIPNYPKYYDKNKINPKAFLDARDLLMNEFPVSVDEILHTPQSKTGIIRPDKMNFENGFTVDFDGNVYNPNRKIIFNSNLTGEKVKFIDPLNNKVTTENGIRIELPEDFLDNYFDDVEKIIKENDMTSNELKKNHKEVINPKNVKDRVKEIQTYVKLHPKKIEDIEIKKDTYAVYKGYPITFQEKYLIELPLENVYLGDLLELKEKVSMVDEIKQYNTKEKELGICNFKDIPYAKLTSLLLWGGGERGVKPLSSSPITDKDIVFAPNGTVKYSGTQSTISISRNGCSRRTYRTGHVCMWTSSNQLGVKRSLIQYIYRFCASIGLFNANIPRLMGYKRIRIFGGLCIGGLLERALCAWQERISEKINDLFQCVPAPLDTDLTKSGFDNATYPHGASLKTVEELDNLQSVKFGDRFVINLVPPEVTGLTYDACGVFVFDPNEKLIDVFPWSYKKIWRGKPFNPRDNNVVIQEFGNMFNNPLIQDTLMNTNALGEDSISRKLMALLYAYLKKQILLSQTDIKSSMQTIVESAIYEGIDKCTDNIGYFVYLKEYRKKRYARIPRGRSKDSDYIDVEAYKRRIDMDYIKIFQTHFQPLIDAGLLKFPSGGLKPVYKIRYEYYGGKSERSKSYVTNEVDYYKYDFSKYNYEEFLCPFEEHLDLYDAMLFALKHVPTQQLIDIFHRNNDFMEQVNFEESKKYKNVKTLNDFVKLSDEKDSIKADINGNLDFIKYELDYDDQPDYAFEQCRYRLDYFINKKKVF
ncbi:TypeIII-RM-meth domain-containing protein [Fusobacterium necrophorum subsp. funduliforme]|uniref:hypothetical protein n=1 Tax=Fusobacterium necrophorum TaxID=859 RepID=UPI000D12F3F9|nr:hypothetical protein [Fusobacterium necrophorum]AVQ21484.1 hypothetical protein C4N15_07405 [Fusobacterium necrophorum subsp. funduliforme]